MRSRTHLTTPPGEEPSSELDVRDTQRERYSPGFARPTEPPVASRYRRGATIVVVLAVLVALGYGAFRLVTSGQYEDPALTDVPADADATP